MLLTEQPASGGTLILSEARAVARKVGHKIANHYGAEDWKVKGCYKTSHSRGRCVIRFYNFAYDGYNCTFAINVWDRRGVTYSSYYADDCT